MIFYKLSLEFKKAINKDLKDLLGHAKLATEGNLAWLGYKNHTLLSVAVIILFKNSACIKIYLNVQRYVTLTILEKTQYITFCRTHVS